MKTSRRHWSVLAALLLILGVWMGSAISAHSTPIGVLSGPVVLDPPIDRMRLDPVGSKLTPDLTVGEAIAKAQEGDPQLSLPSDATAYLGLYSAAVGDGSYRFRSRLAWALTWSGSCPPPPSLAPSQQGGAALVPCTTWLLLDAQTGEMLEGHIQFD